MVKRLQKGRIMHAAVEHGGMLFLGGIVADDTSLGMGGQTRDVCRKIEAVLTKATLPFTARVHALRLEPAGVTQWGESNLKNYDDYYAFLSKWGVLKQPVAAKDLAPLLRAGAISQTLLRSVDPVTDMADMPL